MAGPHGRDADALDRLEHHRGRAPAGVFTRITQRIQARHQPGNRLTASDIRVLITSLGDLRDVIRDATPAEKSAIYDQLGLKITLKPGEAKIQQRALDIRLRSGHRAARPR